MSLQLPAKERDRWVEKIGVLVSQAGEREAAEPLQFIQSRFSRVS